MTAVHVIGSPEKQGVALPEVASEVELGQEEDGAPGIQYIRPPGEHEILPVQAGFDYGALPIEIRDEAKSAARDIKELMGRAIVEVGAALSRIKDRLPHGQFGKWLSAEFGLSARSAQNYIAAAALVSKYETVSVLQPKTLYLLASPSTPDPIRQMVIERFDAGEPLPDSTVKEMIRKAKDQQQETERRAAEEAHEAKLSSRTLRIRAQRGVEEGQRRQNLDRKRAEEEAAAKEAADLLISHLPPEAVTRFRKLIDNSAVYMIAGALCDRLQADRAKQVAVSARPEVSKQETPPAPAEMTRAGDAEIMASDAYRKAVELFEQQIDKPDALAFAREVYRRKKTGEVPQHLSEWQMLCWNMRDDVRAVFVRHTLVLPRAA